MTTKHTSECDRAAVKTKKKRQKKQKQNAQWRALLALPTPPWSRSRAAHHAY